MGRCAESGAADRALQAGDLRCGARGILASSAARQAREPAMIIDWHTHLYPPEETEKPHWKGRCQMTLDNVLRAQDEAGIDATVVSNPGNYWAKLPAEAALPVVERQNRYYAEMQDRYPGRIFAMAGCNPYGGEAYLRELERAVSRDGVKGVCITSSFKGH